MNLETAIMLLPGLVIGLSLHEFAHAWSASLLGDNFSRRQGRVTLNPARHMSILGTLAIFFLPLGWGKPVQVNLYNFKNPKRDYLITSLAGPLANIVVVICCIGLAQFTRHDCSYGVGAQRHIASAHNFLGATALINTILATINLLPIPPLDGSKIWPCLFPGLKPSFGARGIMIFIVAIMFLLHTGALDPVLQTAFNSTSYYMPFKDSVVSEALDKYGQDELEEGKLDRAEELFTAAIAYNPHAHEPLQHRAVVSAIRGDFDKALADIELAMKLPGAPSKYEDLRKEILEAMREKQTTTHESPDSQPATASQPTSQLASRPVSQPASQPSQPDQSDKSSQ